MLDGRPRLESLSDEESRVVGEPLAGRVSPLPLNHHAPGLSEQPKGSPVPASKRKTYDELIHHYGGPLFSGRLLPAGLADGIPPLFLRQRSGHELWVSRPKVAAGAVERPGARQGVPPRSPNLDCPPTEDGLSLWGRPCPESCPIRSLCDGHPPIFSPPTESAPCPARPAMKSPPCPNMNHRRSNAPVRHCPDCGAVVNGQVGTCHVLS